MSGLAPHLGLALVPFLFTIPEILAGAALPALGSAIVGGLLAPLTIGPWVSAYRQVVEEADDELRLVDEA